MPHQQWHAPSAVACLIGSGMPHQQWHARTGAYLLGRIGLPVGCRNRALYKHHPMLLSKQPANVTGVLQSDGHERAASVLGRFTGGPLDRIPQPVDVDVLQPGPVGGQDVLHHPGGSREAGLRALRPCDGNGIWCGSILGRWYLKQDMLFAVRTWRGELCEMG